MTFIVLTANDKKEMLEIKPKKVILEWWENLKEETKYIIITKYYPKKCKKEINVLNKIFNNWEFVKQLYIYTHEGK